jgi:hypothetical protein
MHPDFWAMSDQEQMHELAVAIVAAESYPSIRELLVGGLYEIRTQQSPRPVLADIRRHCRGERRKGVSRARWV